MDVTKSLLLISIALNAWMYFAPRSADNRSRVFKTIQGISLINFSALAFLLNNPKISGPWTYPLDVILMLFFAVLFFKDLEYRRPDPKASVAGRVIKNTKHSQ